MLFLSCFVRLFSRGLRVEFLLKTDSGYPKDTGFLSCFVQLFSRGTLKDFLSKKEAHKGLCSQDTTAELKKTTVLT